MWSGGSCARALGNTIKRVDIVNNATIVIVEIFVFKAVFFILYYILQFMFPPFDCRAYLRFAKRLKNF